MTLPDLGSGLLDVVARTAIIYLAMLLLLRLAGKREVAQLSMLELVTLLLIANAVQNSMVGENTSVAGGLLAAATLVALDRGLGLLRERSRRFRRVVEGEPRLLVRDGVVLRRALREEGLTEDELHAALRQHGVARAADVRLAVLETNGTISVVPAEPGKPSR